MRIGPYNLGNSLVLAPMAGVTDRPFRTLCRRLGAGLAVSEMVSSNSALFCRVNTLRRLNHQGEPDPVAMQIVGADPNMMADAARRCADLGAGIIDINMGCPAKKVCRRAAGSALLRDEPMVRRILQTVVSAVDVPVTLKIRTGWDPHQRNGVRIACIAEDSGIQAVTVHGRTRECGYAGKAEYETIKSIKHTVSIPVIANGDIDSPQKAREVLDYSGADGLMIGRAARGRPWIFREIEVFLATGKPLEAPTAEWTRGILLDHLKALYAFYGEIAGVRIARKHIAWYSKCQPGAAELRARVNRSETKIQQLAEIERYFSRLRTKEDLAA